MATLRSVLPAPVRSNKWSDGEDSDEDDALEMAFNKTTTVTPKAPPYGQRRGWVPRNATDFGDGGAFPEIHVAQYPMGMGQKDNSSSGKALALTVDANGKVKYDAILRQGQDKDKIIYSSYKDLVPVDITKDDPKRQLPDEDAIKEATEKTKKALQKLVDDKVSSAQPTHIAKQNNKAQYIRYTPADQGEDMNSGAQQRIIRMVEVQRDPMEPPKFKTNKKIPRGPPSPPAPVMHSPPRKVTAQEQNDWKVPPCISNWKNQKGFTIPLHMRLAADGRGLQDVQINDKFAKFSAALYIAERKSRDAIDHRRQILQKASLKEKEKREDDLRSLAQQARAERSGLKIDADEANDVLEREEIREDRRRERQRLYNIANAAPDKQKQLLKDKDRDVSERIALGLPAPAGSGGGYDERLFNQSQGIGAGFSAEDSYDVYSKPFRGETSSSIYRPTRGKDDFTEEDLEKLKTTSRFRADKGFTGTDGDGQRSGPVQFEKEEDFGLDDFLNKAKDSSSKKRSDRDSARGHDDKRSRRR